MFDQITGYGVPAKWTHKFTHLSSKGYTTGKQVVWVGFNLRLLVKWFLPGYNLTSVLFIVTSVVHMLGPFMALQPLLILDLPLSMTEHQTYIHVLTDISRKAKNICKSSGDEKMNSKIQENVWAPTRTVWVKNKNKCLLLCGLQMKWW